EALLQAGLAQRAIFLSTRRRRLRERAEVRNAGERSDHALKPPLGIHETRYCCFVAWMLGQGTAGSPVLLVWGEQAAGCGRGELGRAAWSVSGANTTTRSVATNWRWPTWRHSRSHQNSLRIPDGLPI